MAAVKIARSVPIDVGAHPTARKRTFELSIVKLASISVAIADWKLSDLHCFVRRLIHWCDSNADLPFCGSVHDIPMYIAIDAVSIPDLGFFTTAA
jgi:hypothetical protein